MNVDAVTAAVEHVAATVVTPRFRALAEGEAREKGRGDVVTVVDTEAEAALTTALREVLDVPVVGEEAAAAHPDLVDLLAEAPRAWVVDPLDGTQAFVDGSPEHSVMVGLVAHGEAVAGWIHLPQLGRTFVAERGAGARLNGAPLAPPRRRGAPRCAVSGAFLRSPAALRGVRRLGARAGGGLWSGNEYSRMLTGESEAAAFGRTWPWDHTAGAVLLREVGGVSRHLDGAEYRPTGRRPGIVAAVSEDVYATVTAALRG